MTASRTAAASRRSKLDTRTQPSGGWTATWRCLIGLRTISTSRPATSIVCGSRVLVPGRVGKAGRERTARRTRALTERSGHHRNFVGGIERGEQNVSSLGLKRLTEALGCAVQVRGQIRPPSQSLRGAPVASQSRRHRRFFRTGNAAGSGEGGDKQEGAAEPGQEDREEPGQKSHQTGQPQRGYSFSRTVHTCTHKRDATYTQDRFQSPVARRAFPVQANPERDPSASAPQPRRV